MPSPRKAFTLIELMVAIAVIAILVGISVPVFSTAREHARKMQCRNNLQQLGIGMIQYVDQFGEGRYYSWPGRQRQQFFGGHWVASLYWVGLIQDPDLFICPSTADNNENGGKLGTRFRRRNIKPDEVSYAGRCGRRKSRGPSPGTPAIIDRMPSNTLMMSDDTEATENHEDGYNMVYFDGHAEWGSEMDTLVVVRRNRRGQKRSNRRPRLYASSVLRN